MSGLFENYKNKATGVPYNDKVYLPDIRDTKDVIVIGGTNDHVFEIPFKLEELDMFWITYTQGTEVKITKEYYPSYFNKRDDGTYYYPEDGSILVELTPEQVEKYIEKEDNPFNDTFQPTYSVLFYTLSPDQSLLFNDYNKEVFVELKASVKSSLNEVEQDLVQDSISFSKKYKLKVVGTLRPTKPQSSEGQTTMSGFGYTED